MNGPGEQGLPGAGLSQDEDRQLGTGRDPGEPEAGGHGLVVALEILESVVPLSLAFTVDARFIHRAGGSAITAWEMKGVRPAVHVNGTLNDPADLDRGWQIEIAIPWSAL